MERLPADRDSQDLKLTHTHTLVAQHDSPPRSVAASVIVIFQSSQPKKFWCISHKKALLHNYVTSQVEKFKKSRWHIPNAEAALEERNVRRSPALTETQYEYL